MTTSAKPHQIKAWPELRGLVPLLADLGKSPRGRSIHLHLDLSQVHKLDSIGLSIYLARVSQFIEKAEEVTYFMTLPDKQDIRDRLQQIDLLSLIGELNLKPKKERDLFDLDLAAMTDGRMRDDASSGERDLCIVIRPSEGRGATIAQAKSKIKNFFQRNEGRIFAQEQLMIIFLEMVKNTLDHSGKTAYLALTVSERSGQGSLQFSYCDTGQGIGKSIRQFIQADASGENPQLLRLKVKGGFSDILHWAMQPGNSTKSGNGVNFGLGLMLIVDGAKNCGMRLALKDADSVWHLTSMESSSHADIRKYGIATNAGSLMMFSGELEYQI
ncbi:hypothetical protein [Herbaspirillum camelliae]|uniref:hypothetical protein n=1 Tax=Herbaspirillum camelliae TaxID=1892903 RepID=UPI00117B570B|nr:hypothetical protein [Herbaspirillum camelliae]